MAAGAALRLVVRRPLELIVEPHEVERSADPTDPRDHVRPAHDEAEPVERIAVHGVTASASRNRAIAAISRSAAAISVWRSLRSRSRIPARIAALRFSRTQITNGKPKRS